MAMSVPLTLVVAACLVASCSAGPGDTNFTLPSLPYATEAFETSIDNQTMWLHWNKHTNTYATKLNDALLTSCKGLGLSTHTLYKLNTLVGTTVSGRCSASLCPAIRMPDCEKAVRNHGGGLYNHALFFLHNLAPFGTQTYEKDASPKLKAALLRDFGSFQTFQANFTAAATGVFGSGWAWLVAVPAARGPHRLVITTSPNQDNPLMGLAPVKGFPILGLDVWEHAYYLKYQNRRNEYVPAFFSVINWKGVSALHASATAGLFHRLDVLRLNTTVWK